MRDLALFDAYRESAYDRDEWRVVATHPRTKEQVVNTNAVNEFTGRVLLKAARSFDADARLEHRRVPSEPAWVRVPEAGDGDA